MNKHFSMYKAKYSFRKPYSFLLWSLILTIYIIENAHVVIAVKIE